MAAYLVRRLLLLVPTLFVIMLVNFVVLQFLPGGPVEQIIAKLTGTGGAITQRITQTGAGDLGAPAPSGGGQGGQGAGPRGDYRGAQGLDPQFVAELEKQFGLDKPMGERFLIMMRNYLVFDFGDSFFRDRPVFSLILDKMPVSISLGVWSTLIIYLISIPLGVAKAVRDGSEFDAWTSGVVVVGTAVPGFLFAVFLLVVFAGGQYLDWFPLRGLVSENWHQLSLPDKVLDYFWHLVLPILALSIGGFAALTMLTKNSFMDQINQQYVTTARAKGLTERRVLYGHVFRNAMLIVIAGFPGQLIGMLFTGSVLIEVIFSLDGLGRLGFEAVFQRDYPVVLGTLYVFTLMGLVMGIVTDMTYTLIDPRIDFESREV
ncbi:microcin C transport system permease protein [Tistlia consotensis]|uniref:Microcin C transport system permease protein n=1 Tax=Tistlia consotensis USBA 355 TaxID=560819 RepID=A0A1Y6BH77_9PROT|nr:microcin C ABC transporter permease YejB [Tistlia consotensis]SMF07501.1 microcin C transport system permease protein [Tistlia consotensis USBA 355]SNR35845.1 microcin C transport system permease protein [Tistlia consotensis]